MLRLTDDLRIKEIKELIPPETVTAEFPATDTATSTVITARAEAVKPPKWPRVASDRMNTPSSKA